MQIKNLHTGTEPLIAHAQGRSHFTKEWYAMVGHVIPKQESINFPGLDQITIVTYIEGYMPTSLDRQLKKAGIPFIDLARHYQHDGPWTNVMKIKYLHRYLQEEASTPYILSLDVIDVLLSDDLSTLIDRFLAMDCGILYGASINCHPTDLKTAEDQEAIWKYLNAGTMLGKTADLKAFYTELDAVSGTAEIMNINNEQRLIRTLRNGWGNIKADTGCQIFQTLACTDYLYENGLLTVNGARKH